MNLRFKEGQMVKMTGYDDMIVEGAIGIITDVQTETVKVLWGGMSAFKVDYKYRYGLKEITTTEELQYGDLLCICHELFRAWIELH